MFTTQRTKRLLACGSIGLAGLGLAGSVGASATQAPQQHDAADVAPTDLDNAVDHSTADANNIAETNQDAARLAEFLKSKGIAFTMHEDPTGNWVETTPGDNSASDAIEDFYWQSHPTPQSEIDAQNAEAQEIVAHLQSRGISASITTDRHGMQSYNYDVDNPRVDDAMDDYWWTKAPTPQADIDAANTDVREVVAALKSQGIAAEVITGKHGVLEWKADTNDERTVEAITAFYANKYPDADSGI
jgi:hypothetical protein